MLRSLLVLIIAFYSSLSFAQDTPEDPCIGFQFSDIVGQAGDTVCSELRVTDFVDILSFQFSVQFDDIVLEYVSCTNENLIRSFQCADVNLQDGAPVLKALWFEPLGNLTTLDSAAVLMSLCFNLKADAEAGTTYLAFSDDLASEASVGDPNDLSVAVRREFCPTGDITSSLQDVSQNSFMSIYPNPVETTLFIQNVDSKRYPVRLSIYNTTGLLVQAHQVKPSQSSISTDGLNTGHYFIRIDMNDGTGYSTSLTKL